MNPQIFRKAALERLSSPERLDSLMEVVNLKAWIALVACLVVILAAVIWGCLGRVADEVAGMGILARPGGLYNADTSGAGPLLEIRVKVGDPVVKGQTLATLDCPDLQGRIQEAENQLGALERQRTDFLPLLTRESQYQMAAYRGQRAALEETGQSARERVAYLEQRVVDLKQALDQGLLPVAAYQDVRQQLATAREQVAGGESRAHELTSREASEEARISQKVFDLDREIAELRGRLGLMRSQWQTAIRVASPYSGKVVEILKDPGQYVPAGTPVVRLELSTGPYVGYLLVPLEGKRLRPGMAVQMEPSGIPPEEFGRMQGRIQTVSHSPASLEGLEVILRSSLLASKLAGTGDAYLVEVQPELDPATVSGFRWTTRGGPPMTFGGGTLLTGRIRIRDQAPITLVIPALRKWLEGHAHG